MQGLLNKIMNHRITSIGHQLDLPLHHLKEVAPEHMPEYVQQLLVHNRDMTGRLAAFHQSSIQLRTLMVNRQNQQLFRRVLLETANGQTVEFGAICIYLDRFSGQALAEVLAGNCPLGRILNQHQLEFRCNLQGFFSLASYPELESLFGLVHSGRLFGRANQLETPEGLPIADVIEILPPA